MTARKTTQEKPRTYSTFTLISRLETSIMSDTDTIFDTSDEERFGVSVGGKAPRIGPIIKKGIPVNGTANGVLTVSDEAFKIVSFIVLKNCLRNTSACLKIEFAHLKGSERMTSGQLRSSKMRYPLIKEG